MRFSLLLFVCVLLVSCGGDQGDSGNKSESVEQETPINTMVIVTDSLKGIFQSIHASRKDWLPSKLIYEIGKLNPVDEALTDTTFFIFREQLLRAIEKKDAFHLLDKTAKEIKYSFGDDDGLAGFVQMWHLDSQEGIRTSEIWSTLKEVLTKGGTFSDGGKTFVAPYYYSVFPEEYDAFTHGVILGRGVRMRAEPNLTSAVVKSLSFDVVEILNETSQFQTIGEEAYPWINIKLPDGKEGYVWGKFIGKPIDFRAGFIRQPNGRWLMHFFVAGD